MILMNLFQRRASVSNSSRLSRTRSWWRSSVRPCRLSSAYNSVIAYNRLEEVDPNNLYDQFLTKFNNGFNACFPLKPKLNWRHSPRKEWMTAGLVRSCNTKSLLFKKFTCKPIHENIEIQ